MLDKSITDNIKRVDPDRYRAALLAARDQRDALMTIYAFHCELAKVPEIVSETMIGNIRYQWWRDALEEIYLGKPVRAHEVSTPLSSVVKDNELSRFKLDQLIDGRERDLDPTPFADLQEASEYSRSTSGILAELSAQLMSASEQETASELGTLWGLTGLARSWRYYTNGMLSNLNFKELLDDIDTRYTAISSQGRIPASLIPAIGYTCLIPLYLNQMQSPDYDPKSMAPTYSQLRKKLRLMKTALSGQI